MQLLLSILLWILQYQQPSQVAGTVTLTVNKINTSKKGELLIAIYTKDTFPVSGKEQQKWRFKVTAPSMTVPLGDIPPGHYAIGMMQDYDADYKMKTNLVGYPQEPFGFSHNPKLRLGPPSFDSAKFSVVSGKNTHLSIDLR
jgi:uncharacterized protein (DUF2141 family)